MTKSITINEKLSMIQISRAIPLQKVLLIDGLNLKDGILNNNQDLSAISKENLIYLTKLVKSHDSVSKILQINDDELKKLWSINKEIEKDIRDGITKILEAEKIRINGILTKLESLGPEKIPEYLNNIKRSLKGPILYPYKSESGNDMNASCGNDIKTISCALIKNNHYQLLETFLDEDLKEKMDRKTTIDGAKIALDLCIEEIAPEKKLPPTTFKGPKPPPPPGPKPPPPADPKPKASTGRY
jgi:hypothetical protein